MWRREKEKEGGFKRIPRPIYFLQTRPKCGVICTDYIQEVCKWRLTSTKEKSDVSVVRGSVQALMTAGSS